ncbi:MAG: hypothetical protein ABIA63_03345, partial [bacterium]
FRNKIKAQTEPEEYFETTSLRSSISLSYLETLYIIRGSLRGLIDIDKRDGIEYRLGIEYMFNNLLYLRCGKHGSNLMFGAGIHLKQGLYFDYAFSKYDLNSTPYWINMGFLL